MIILWLPPGLRTIRKYKRKEYQGAEPHESLACRRISTPDNARETGQFFLALRTNLGYWRRRHARAPQRCRSACVHPRQSREAPGETRVYRTHSLRGIRDAFERRRIDGGGERQRSIRRRRQPYLLGFHGDRCRV